MSEQLVIIVPKALIDKLNEIAKKENIEPNDLILRAVVKILEEEEGGVQ